MPEKLPTVTILLSGRGSNMQAIHRASVDGRLAATVTVISNEPDAAGLLYAQQNGVKATIIDHRDYKHREDFDQALAELIEADKPDLVLLAGFMRRLGAAFTKRFESRLINIHPSLLPRYPGLNTHQKAIDHGDEWHGCSIHFVTEELDGGPVIARSTVRIDHQTDSADTLAAKVLKKEHNLYWQIARMCLNKTVECRDGHIIYQGTRLRYPILL